MNRESIRKIANLEELIKQRDAEIKRIKQELPETKKALVVNISVKERMRMNYSRKKQIFQKSKYFNQRMN